MDKKKYWVTWALFVLFSVSVSVAILPCGIINVHGLFGEISTCTVIEDKEQSVVNTRSIEQEKKRTANGVNIFNIWFEFLIAVVCISLSANLENLPRGDTIVTLKVRMDD